MMGQLLSLYADFEDIREARVEERGNVASGSRDVSR